MTAYYNTTLMDDTIRVKVCNCNPRQSTSHPATDASTATTRQEFALITVVTIVTVSGLRVVRQDVILVKRFAVHHSHHVPSRGGGAPGQLPEQQHQAAVQLLGHDRAE